MIKRIETKTQAARCLRGELWCAIASSPTGDGARTCLATARAGGARVTYVTLLPSMVRRNRAYCNGLLSAVYWIQPLSRCRRPWKHGDSQVRTWLTARSERG